MPALNYIIIIPILQTRKLKLRKVKYLITPQMGLLDWPVFFPLLYANKILLLAITSLSIREFPSSHLIPEENNKKADLDRIIIQ